MFSGRDSAITSAEENSRFFPAFSGKGCDLGVVLGGDAVVGTENFDEVTAGTESAAAGDLGDLEPGGLEQMARRLQTAGGQVGAEADSELVVEEP